ncbi:hypothetical protein K438DRAFT_1851579, partial [Mycena galopus ATCC 62051]
LAGIRLSLTLGFQPQAQWCLAFGTSFRILAVICVLEACELAMPTLSWRRRRPGGLSLNGLVSGLQVSASASTICFCSSLVEMLVIDYQLLQFSATTTACYYQLLRSGLLPPPATLFIHSHIRFIRSHIRFLLFAFSPSFLRSLYLHDCVLRYIFLHIAHRHKYCVYILLHIAYCYILHIRILLHIAQAYCYATYCTYAYWYMLHIVRMW